MYQSQTKLNKTAEKQAFLRCQYWVFVAALSICTFLSSCFEETFVEDPSVRLTFSVDTLRFDTVFTTLGSATRSIKIFNPSGQNIIVPSIGLANGDQGPFRLNVDGIAANRVENVEILANDSLYVFVEVTIDPDQPLSVSPFIIYDRMEVRNGGEIRSVTLEAWGQNANYFPSKDANGQLIRLTCDNGDVVWDDQRPYVVYGLLFIDSCRLQIAPGTDIYFHGGLARADDLIFSQGGLIFMADGKLEARGTLEQPITFQGDRLESVFDDSPGQWPGLRFLSSSTGNAVDFVKIENSTVGLRVDSAADLTVTNAIIRQTSSTGIIGVHATIDVDNSVIHSNGGQSVLLAYGGTYRFRHVTLANFENQEPALYMDNFTCLNSDCSAVESNPLSAHFINSIIAGSNDDEFLAVDITGGGDPSFFDISLDHSLVRINESKMDIDFDALCISCIEWGDEDLFLSQDDRQFTLDTTSVARQAGTFLTELPLDLLGRPRDAQAPDLGCYEFEE